MLNLEFYSIYSFLGFDLKNENNSATRFEKRETNLLNCKERLRRYS